MTIPVEIEDAFGAHVGTEHVSGAEDCGVVTQGVDAHLTREHYHHVRTERRGSWRLPFGCPSHPERTRRDDVAGALLASVSVRQEATAHLDGARGLADP